MINEPRIQIVHPSRPRCPSSSFKRYEARIALHARSKYCGWTLIPTHPMITLSEPNGVTNIGGAKEYAAKFATNVKVRISGK